METKPSEVFKLKSIKFFYGNWRDWFPFNMIPWPAGEKTPFRIHVMINDLSTMFREEYETVFSKMISINIAFCSIKIDVLKELKYPSLTVYFENSEMVNLDTTGIQNQKIELISEI